MCKLLNFKFASDGPTSFFSQIQLEFLSKGKFPIPDKYEYQKLNLNKMKIE